MGRKFISRLRTIPDGDFIDEDTLHTRILRENLVDLSTRELDAIIDNFMRVEDYSNCGTTRRRGKSVGSHSFKRYISFHF
jgi:hypothetical protein